MTHLYRPLCRPAGFATLRRACNGTTRLCRRTLRIVVQTCRARGVGTE